jgi:hypothetical protein
MATRKKVKSKRGPKAGAKARQHEHVECAIVHLCMSGSRRALTQATWLVELLPLARHREMLRQIEGART